MVLPHDADDRKAQRVGQYVGPEVEKRGAQFAFARRCLERRQGNAENKLRNSECEHAV